MRSVRKALREGAVQKDTYGRLSCTSCDVDLKNKDDPDAIGTVRRCPECGQEWKDIR